MEIKLFLTIYPIFSQYFPNQASHFSMICEKNRLSYNEEATFGIKKITTGMNGRYMFKTGPMNDDEK